MSAVRVLVRQTVADLTGRTRFRVSWRGKLVLQVEERTRAASMLGDWCRRWRDAKAEDLDLTNNAEP